MWFEQYLLSLRENCKDLHEANYSEKIKTEDVVLIRNPIKPRPYWQLGRVVELFREDNKIRSGNVKKGEGLTQKHSLKHFYPLEWTLTHDSHLKLTT